MQLSILKGIYADPTAGLNDSYPINLEPQLVDSGISKGLLRMSPGITTLAEGPGFDRGAITWRNTCFRVMGKQLVSVVGSTVTQLGSVGEGGPVRFDYSLERLAVASELNLFYWDGALTRVTDVDLGNVIDVCWVDGYFMTTDGEFLVVTDLNDPTSVNPLKYGSSEADPDPIVALRKVRNEIYAVNANTIENFQNIGGDGFPFQRNPGGLIPKGAVGTYAVAYFLDTFAFVGGGRDEANSVYLAGSGEAVSISTSQVDLEIAKLTPAQQALIEVEARVDRNEQRLLIHLPSKTLVYFHQASLANKSPVWTILASGVLTEKPYAGRHFVQAEGRWIGGSNVNAHVGYLNDAVETHFGAVAGWRFDTNFIYNAAKGGLLKALELIGVPGRGAFGSAPTMSLSVSQDGETWSQERFIAMGTAGQRGKRLQWRPKIKFANYAGLRFRGANTGIASFIRLEADIEPLNV